MSFPQLRSRNINQLTSSPQVGDDITGSTITSGSQLFAGVVALVIAGATIVSGSTLHAGSVAPVVEGSTISSGSQLFSGTVDLSVDGGTITGGTQLFAGSISQDILGATISSGSQLFSGAVSPVSDISYGRTKLRRLWPAPFKPSVLGQLRGFPHNLLPHIVTAQQIDGAIISSTQLFAGAVDYVVSGETISTTQLFAGSVELVISGATISATQLFAGSTEDVINGATISGTQLFAGSISQDVSGATIPSGSQLFSGSVSTVDTVDGAFIPSGSQLFAGQVQTQRGLSYGRTLKRSWPRSFAPSVLGQLRGNRYNRLPGILASQAVVGGTISTTQLFAGTVALTVSGATISSGSQLFAGSVALEVSGATISSGSQLFAGSVGQTIVGGHVSSTQVFPGSLVPDGTIGGETIPSGSQLFAGSVSIDITGASISSGNLLFSGTVTPEFDVTGGTIVSGLQLFPGSVTVDVTGAIISSTQLFPGSAAPEGTVLGGTITSGSQLFSGSVGLVVVGGTISATQLYSGVLAIIHQGGGPGILNASVQQSTLTDVELLTMSARTSLTDEIPEQTTPVIAFQIVDRVSAGFLPETLTLTLYDAKSDTIINSRDEQNALNVNGVTVDASGNVEFQMGLLDTAILDDTAALETHIALFEWSWNGGTLFGRHEIQHVVRNFEQVF